MQVRYIIGASGEVTNHKFVSPGEDAVQLEDGHGAPKARTNGDGPVVGTTIQLTSPIEAACEASQIDIGTPGGSVVQETTAAGEGYAVDQYADQVSPNEGNHAGSAANQESDRDAVSNSRANGWTSELQIPAFQALIRKAASGCEQYQRWLRIVRPNKFAKNGDGKPNGRKQRLPNKMVEVDGLLYQYDEKNQPTILVVPNNNVLRNRIMELVHDTDGHTGRDYTYNKLKQRFWWRGMFEDTKEYVQGCIRCLASKYTNKPLRGLLMPLPVSEIPFENISVDITPGLPLTKHGHNAILVFVDYCTKMKILVPINMDMDAKEIIKMFEKEILTKYGTPKSVVGDGGSVFMSKKWEDYRAQFNIENHSTSSYHPDSDGQTERVNKQIGDIMRIYCSSHQHEWEEHVPWVQFALNAMPNSTTGFTQYYLLHGTKQQRP